MTLFRRSYLTLPSNNRCKKIYSEKRMKQIINKKYLNNFSFVDEIVLTAKSKTQIGKMMLIKKKKNSRIIPDYK